MAHRLGEDQLHEVIGLIYEAALDPQRWRTVMEHLSHCLNAEAVTLFVHDFSTSLVADGPPGAALRTVGFDPAYVASYVEHYASTNVWAQNEAALAEGAAVTSEMLYPQTRLAATEFYADWLRPQQLSHAMGGIIVRDDHLAVKLSALRSCRAGAYQDPELDFYRRLLPHLKRACQINKRLEHERTVRHAHSHAASEWAASSTHLGILTLSTKAEVLFANPRGESLLRQQSHLCLRDGQLQGLNTSDTSRLATSLKHTASTGKTTHAQLSGTGAQGPCFITLMPAPVTSAWRIAEHQQLVLCLITESGHSRRVPGATQLMDLFNLTPAEARLARAIARGESVETYAQAEGIQRTTVRTQLQKVFTKTGVVGQRELILLLLALPATR